MRRLLLPLLLLALLPSAANAATARVDVYVEPPGTEPESSCSRYMQCPPNTLVFTAAPGEANNVTITVAGSAYVVSDAGAPVDPGSGCERVDPSTVRCNGATTIGTVTLGDRDDRVDAPVGGRVLGEGGNDVLNTVNGDGGAGNDVMTCPASAPGCALDGGAGSDRVTGGTGTDTLAGGPGGAGDDDILDGADGIDQLNYEGHPAGIEVDLTTTTHRFASAGENDLIAHFEFVTGGDGDDVLVGADVAVPPTGLGALFAMRGGGGGDQITVRAPMAADGGPGNDRITGPTSASGFTGGTGDDELTGGPGRDVLEGGGGDDTLRGLEGRDTLTGESGDDDLGGGPGNDRLTGSSGADALSGDAGNDVLDGRDRRRTVDRLNCGVGSRDRASADPRDRVRGCERVARRRR